MAVERELWGMHGGEKAGLLGKGRASRTKEAMVQSFALLL